ncbi:MAG TPA: chorismate synthase [Desulfotomaculum sp.]|nr:MAG: Chorismate synthase [Desulfotomaculum sp. 46_80]KUK85371.1 MAG: Chorismate synthase [Desulfofundulus kuznetsovii]HAG10627.1 chorismate synthase [Desulfotomaculum sp.]HBY03518.1 chorismate synthase [Desulfotomaculum sp.]
MLRYLTSGESHGPELTAIIEGLPAGLPLSKDYINKRLARRQGGYGRGGRMAIENDQVVFLSGVRGGITIGSPIALQIKNRDWINWKEIMASDESASLGQRGVTRPRPGHADLAGALKYDQQDIRNVLERASARETAARVAVGSAAERLLEMLGIIVIGYVVQIGSITVSETSGYSKTSQMERTDLQMFKEALSGSQLYCPDSKAEEAMKQEIDHAKATGDSLGGVFEVCVFGLPPGLGSYVQWDRRLDGNLARSLMSIPSIKGVEIGLGFTASRLPGSLAHDEIYHEKGKGFYRLTNRAGGLEGGVTNGEPLIIRAAVKPIPTLYKPLHSVDLLTHEPQLASVERADTCSVPAASVIGEAAVAWELSAAFLDKFGGDTIDELRKNYDAYLLRLKEKSI